MPNLGFPELIVLLFVVLLIFGAGKLPEVGGAIGKGLREFRHSSTDPVEPPSRPIEADTKSDRREA